MRRHNILQGRKHKAGDVTRTETKEVKAVWLIREEESLVWNNHTGGICLGRAFRFDMLPYTWVQRLEAWFHLKWPQIWTKPGRYRCCTWHQCIFFFFSRLKSGRRGTLMELSADPAVRSLLHLIFSPRQMPCLSPAALCRNNSCLLPYGLENTQPTGSDSDNTATQNPGWDLVKYQLWSWYKQLETPVVDCNCLHCVHWAKTWKDSRGKKEKNSEQIVLVWLWG